MTSLPKFDDNTTKPFKNDFEWPSGDYTACTKFPIGVIFGDGSIFGEVVPKIAVFGHESVFTKPLTWDTGSSEFGDNCVFKGTHVFEDYQCCGDAPVCEDPCRFSHRNFQMVGRKDANIHPESVLYNTEGKEQSIGARTEQRDDNQQKFWDQVKEAFGDGTTKDSD